MNSLVRVGRDDRFEVEVDAVRAAVPDGRRDLPGEGRPVRRAAEQRLLACHAGRRPGEALDGEHHPGATRMGRIDDARHLGTRPAAPADRRRAVAVRDLEVAVGGGTDAEIGDRREQLVIELGGIHLPVREEPHHLAAESRRCRGAVARWHLGAEVSSWSSPQVSKFSVESPGVL